MDALKVALLQMQNLRSLHVYTDEVLGYGVVGQDLSGQPLDAQAYLRQLNNILISSRYEVLTRCTSLNGSGLKLFLMRPTWYANLSSIQLISELI